MRSPARHPRSSAIERDLVRLADGTLERDRRELVERRVAGSPELQTRLREQRRAVAAARSVARGERAPIALRVAHRTLAPAVRHPALTLRSRLRSRLRPRSLALGVVGTVGALVWTLAAVGGGQAALTVAQAATIAVRPPIASVAKPPDTAVTLPRLRAAGLPFPYWEDRFGWRAKGVRSDWVEGRLLTTVFYRRGASRIAYTIVSGNPLPAGADAEAIARAGTSVASFSTDAERVVTWLRRGHTCVLSGRGVPLDTLLKLAVWRGHGRIPY
jgi:hypothetical protein